MTRPDYCYRLAMKIRVDKRIYDGPLLGIMETRPVGGSLSTFSNGK